MPHSIHDDNGKRNLPPAFALWNQYPQFITYKLVPGDKAGKMDKLPCDPNTGRVANAHNAAIWTTYENARLAVASSLGDGVGFVLTVDDPFWFLDLDNALVDGQWNATAQELSAMLPGAGREISNSRRGFHIIGTGECPPHSCRNQSLGLEFYTEGRFIALTMDDTSGSVATDLSHALPAVIDKFFPPTAETNRWDKGWTYEPVDQWNGPTDDEELIKRALRSKGGANVILGGSVSFKDLWTANEDALAKWKPGTNSAYDASAADAALATRLAFWVGKNCDRIERLMRQSALARDKWDDRPDWLASTIMGACGLSFDVYKSGKLADAAGTIIPPPPHPGHSTDDLGNDASIADKSNHLYLEMMLRGLAHSIQYDEFSDTILLDGTQMTDNTERGLWMALRAATRFSVTWEMFGHVVRHMAYKNRFHPVRRYLDNTQPHWDGVDRCERWLIDSAGAPDTPFVRAVSKIFLIAGVRRIRQPGCKYDELLTLEGPQGYFKSTGFAALVPDERFFTDNITLAMDAKELMEALRGIWIGEVPELSRMNNSEIEHVKAMLARRRDRARPAYARSVEDMPRCSIFGGTTNADRWLRDATGNRRFWPVRISRPVDIRWLTANRDQMWAEAAVREMAGESIRLDPSLYADAEHEQRERMIDDPFADVLAERLGSLQGRIDSSLVWSVLGVPTERRPNAQAKMGDAMKRNGWGRKRFSIGGEKIWKYWRGHHDSEITAETISGAAQGHLADVLPIMPKEAGQ